MKVIRGTSANKTSFFYKPEPEKIVLEKCPRNCIKCKSVLAEINRCFYESDNHRRSKEYQLSILSLKKAFKKTFELREPVDKKCGRIFRMVVIDSLKSIHQELVAITSGFYPKNNYNYSLSLVEKTLEELNASSSKEFNDVDLNFKNLTSGISFA